MTTSDAQDKGAELFAARYGEPVPAPRGISVNPVLETLLSHRSVYSFDDRPLADGILDWLIAAAQSAPSASNRQTWSVIAVRDPEHKAQVAGYAGAAWNQAPILKAPLLLVFLTDLSRIQALADRRGVAAEALDYLDTWLTAALEATIAAQNAAIAAESLGLGTVYIGALRNHPEELAAELGLQRGAFALLGLAVGYADLATPVPIKPRLPASAVLFREQHGAPNLEELERFDRTLHRYQANQNRTKITDWTTQSVDRNATAAELRGRVRLKAGLRELGFELR